MKQTFIVRNHNNVSDGFQTFNAIVQNTTKQIHYYLIGWNEIETTDYLYREISQDNEQFIDEEILAKYGYARKIEPKIP